MQILTNRAQLRRAIRDPALDPHVRALLIMRFEQLGGTGAAFHLIQPGDTIADAEAAIGWPMTDEDQPSWEWCKHHPGRVAEVTFVLSDDGPAQVLIAGPDADPAILDVIRSHA